MLSVERSDRRLHRPNEGHVRVVEDVSFALAAARRSGWSANPAAARASRRRRSCGFCPRRRARIEAGRILFEGDDLAAAAASPRCARCAATGIGMIFQEPMTSLNPTMTRRRARSPRCSRCIAASATAMREPRVLDMLRKVGIGSAERRLEQYPHRALGRPAPAGDDRHGPGLRAEAPDRR